MKNEQEYEINEFNKSIPSKEVSVCCGAIKAYDYKKNGVWKFVCIECDKPFIPSVESNEPTTSYCPHAETLPKDLTTSWEERFSKRFPDDTYDIPYYEGKQFISKVVSQSYDKGQEEYKQFVLNILDGIDEADEEMGNKGGGTKAIRFALASRIITNQ